MENGTHTRYGSEQKILNYYNHHQHPVDAGVENKMEKKR